MRRPTPRPLSGRVDVLEDRVVPATMFAVTSTNTLIRFDSATPGTIIDTDAITGLQASEQVVGIDVRPATGQLYAFGLVDDGATRTGRIYTINPTTGAATQVGGAPWTTAYPDTAFGGFNFNPNVDLIRIISRNGPNFRVSPNTGALVGTDTNTSDTGLNGVAYTNNDGFSPTTTLYGLSFDAAQLVTVGGLNGTPSPNGGQVNVVGNTGVAGSDAYGFEIVSAGGVPTAFATNGGKLYTANLTTGALTLAGAIGGNPFLLGLTAAVDTITVVGTGGTDTLVLRRLSGAQNEYSLNGGAFVAVSSALPFRFNGAAGADLLYVDTSNGDPIPTGGVTYDGEVLRVEKVTGAATEAVVLTPSVTPGSGTLTITGFGNITYVGVGGPGGGGIDLVNFTSATVRTGQANDTLSLESNTTIDNGGAVPAGYSLTDAPALLLGETIVAGVPGVGLRNIGTATVDTVAGGGGGTSAVTLNFTQAAGVGALTVAGGPLADAVTVTSTAAPMNIQTVAGNDTITFAAGATLSGGTLDGGADADTLNYAAYTTPVAVNLGLGVAGLTAALDGGQEVPSNGSTATGTATFSNYNAATKTFDLVLTVAGLAPADVTGLHLHRGGLGINGPVILDLQALGTLVPAGPGFTLTLTGLDLDTSLLGGAANEAAFLGGQTYLNIHTAAFPGGAIRGQVFSTGNVALASGTATGTGGVSAVENVFGGSAADSLIGTTGANALNGRGGNDTLLGGPGADTFLGGANDDTLIWSNGDGSDVMDGEAGTDTVAVNGNLTANDVFTIGTTNARIDFARTSPGPFSLDIGTAEVLRAAGVGGNDSFTFLSAVTAPFQAIHLFGLVGDDTFAVAPSGMPVSVNGGGGADSLDTDATGATDTFLTSAADPAGGVMGSLTFTNRASVFFSQIEPSPEPFNFLTVTATDGVTTAAPGSLVTYTVVVTNNFSVGLGGIGVSDLFPPELTGVTWTAAFTAGSSGATSGSGDITQSVNLAAGGSVTYTVTATLRTDVVGSFTNTATATVPAGLVEANPGDNTATDTTAISAALIGPLFVTGSQSGTERLFFPNGGVYGNGQPFNVGIGGVLHAALGDVTGDGVLDQIIGTGVGLSFVRVINGQTGAVLADIDAFPGYKGGVFVAVGDLNGDGRADIAVTPDADNAFTGPVDTQLPVRIYSGVDFSQIAAFDGLASLGGQSGQAPGTRLGGRPAIADVNADGFPDLLIAAGNGGGPRVTIWDGTSFAGAAGGKPTKAPLANVFVFESSQRGGAFVAAGDVSGDGRAEIIVGGGPNGGPRVRIVDAAKFLALPSLEGVDLDDPANLASGLVLNNFFAGSDTLRGGLRVTVRDVDGDGKADVVTGSGTNERSSVRVYTSTSLTAAAGTSNEPANPQVFDPFGSVLPGGVFVG